MKKLIVIIVVLLAINVKAQSNEAFLKDTSKLVEIISKDAFKPFIAQFSAGIAEDKKEAFKMI